MAEIKEIICRFDDITSDEPCCVIGVDPVSYMKIDLRGEFLYMYNYLVNNYDGEIKNLRKYLIVSKLIHTGPEMTFTASISVDGKFFTGEYRETNIEEEKRKSP
jgi:hypothetical protein